MICKGLLEKIRTCLDYRREPISNSHSSHPGWRLKPWRTILLFGMLQWLIYGIGSFTLDFFAGGATLTFGVWPEVGGVGMFFVYILSFYITLVVVLPILLLQRFGVGMLVYLPYAITGLFVEYYFEMVAEHNLTSYWGVIGWCVVGLAIGSSADLAYRYLPALWSPRWRAILTGVVMGLVNFLLVGAALSFFYVAPQSGSGSFLGVAYYGLPLLLLNSGFAGILMPLPDQGFDPTESAIPWKACSSRGWRVAISTEHGDVAQADHYKLKGPLPGLLSGGKSSGSLPPNDTRSGLSASDPLC